ncbi:secreted protein of unknown function DUF2808 [Synechococcus sp. A18-25c]|uniref:DUF2808 domain-containing protein n=1 Tax=Synechococcus sp. A18-25c TaxID=1866938 RepID=UPI0016492019|nr:DUF2808 domain-containing protein [Synechococcus sp. A18-25c]QNJ19492.1 secreted protein of unknown function DUF2808 [Synechococcus sp. A18-25c]
MRLSTFAKSTSKSIAKAAAIATSLTVALLSSLAPVRSVDLNGQTSFVAVPTKAKLVNYQWYAFQGKAVIYVVLEFPAGAEAGLGAINLDQIRGVQPAFRRGAVPVRAFLGTPRREGEAIAANAEFSDRARNVVVRFPQAVPPGNTVTVAFQLGTNPPADLYTFSLSAIPAGPDPIPQLVGVLQMDILQPFRR